jgi:hypothetical protein
MKLRPNGPERWITGTLLLVCCAGIAAIGLSGSPCLAASIPAWLDEAITKWNQENENIQIEFVDIKDSFVWYMIPDTEETGHQEIRDSIHEIVLGHGYKVTDQEEMVTTGKPPSPINPYKAKKCWKRSYVRDIKELSNTTSSRGGKSGLRQRMLTSLVCDDADYWFTGFRILQ